jgi:serine/threonine-protein kinase
MSFERRRGLTGVDGAEGRRRARRWGASLFTALLALGAGYLLAATVVFSSPDRASGDLVAVPDFAGENVERAEEVSMAAGLALRVAGEIFHPEEAPGRVIAQLPLAGQFVAPGSEVQVTLSLGPETVRVPDVTGLTETQAVFVLGRLGLSTSAITTASRKRKGEVLRTEPDAGAELGVPGEVSLIVSEGREVVAVPDLEGRRLDDVEVLLSRLGLELGSVTFEPSAVGAPGRVIGQSPPPGFGLREGGAVSVRVAGSPSDVIEVNEGGQGN